MCVLGMRAQFLMLCSKPFPHWVIRWSQSIIFLIPILTFLCPFPCFHISIQLIFKWIAQQLILRDWKTLRNQRNTRPILFWNTCEHSIVIYNFFFLLVFTTKPCMQTPKACEMWYSWSLQWEHRTLSIWYNHTQWEHLQGWRVYLLQRRLSRPE